MMATKDALDKTGVRIALAVLVGLIVDGIDLQLLSLALPNITKDMKLSNVMAGALGTYTFAGMALGGVLAGWLADRLGRVRITFWSIIVFSVATSALGFVQTYAQFAIIRLISGMGLAALYSVGSLLASEYVPTRIRTTILGGLQAGYGIGYMLAAIVSSYVLPHHGWRPLFVIAVVPGTICLWLLRGLSDPPSWFASRDAARQSNCKRNEFKTLWADKPTRRTFLVWSMTSVALQFGYYGANTWLPSYLVKEMGINLKSMGWYLAGAYLAAIVGKVAAGYLADAFGRRLMFFLASISTALALPWIMLTATPASVAWLLLILGLLYAAPYGINATYLSESFPTSVRGTAFGTAYNVGRIGSMLSPLLIGYAATHYSISSGIALLGFAYAVCGILPALFIQNKMYDPSAVRVAEIELAALVPSDQVSL